METITNFIFQNYANAHWIIFSCLLLSGLSVPISEDLLIILSGFIASQLMPEKIKLLFITVFFGCFIADSIAYWVGRLLGPKLWKMKWFQKVVPQKFLGNINSFYEKYGFWTLLIGRFIPFGVRNCIIHTAGVGKMNYYKFLISTGTTCLICNITLFFSTYYLGKNLDELLKFFKTFNIFIFLAFAITLISIIWYYLRRKKAKSLIR